MSEETEESNSPKKVPMGKLEQKATLWLYSFLERDGTAPGFWFKTIAGLILATAGPAILIVLYFFARDLGYFK